MLHRTQWFERKFDFSFPVGVFPAVVERLRGTPARLEELVGRIPAGLLKQKPEGRWSIQEHVGHLFDLEELHEGRLDDYASGEDVLREADLTNRKTHEANHNASAIDDLLRLFRAARARIVERLDRMDEAEASASATHPRLGTPMRVVDMAFFAAEHDDHHLAEITRLHRALSTE